ncbi:hypothetical protein MPC4_80163 [Methylocella tundrae]|uniref:Uncharacterized protein n=1 Tax=Methylocella tundrae TaxID=227605 RepID=A0A8B6MC39_METTU|nr:hypothetical protein MPC1_70008 [Methylocella tundrae]VTZ52492.1 hypothetical protein MPC4_80163 [Methylocella tundrae]
MDTPPHQTESPNAFEKAFLRSFADSLGTSYEQLRIEWLQLYGGPGGTAEPNK